MMLIEHISGEMTLFFILYGITGTVPFMAAIYLLMRKGNAIAPDVTPPLRLRRWAAAFFAASVLAHIMWYILYVYINDIHPVGFLAVVLLDYVGMLITIAGTLFAMLQDRKRPLWPAFIAMIPYCVLEILHYMNPNGPLGYIATAYNLSLYVLFSAYMIFALRQYGRWLNDNFTDLENKEVWLSQVVSLVFVLLFILYTLVDTYMSLLYLLHLVELLFFALLLWRVETLPQLTLPTLTQQTPAVIANVDLVKIEQLLTKHCVNKQLFLQHDLTLQQLAQVVGTNRNYLSQYFSRQGITYNTYINNLRINHFISRYQEVVKSKAPFTVQQLASESGYRSYSTFSLAFKQRTGQSVTAWMHDE